MSNATAELVRDETGTKTAIGGHVAGKSFAFEMLFDPGHAADAVHLGFLKTGRPYEPDLTTLFGRVLRPGDKVVDVGANVGWFTMLAASLVGPNGSVISCEPGPDNRIKLKRNIDLNGFAPRVRLIEQPIADRVELVEFHLNSDCSGGHALWNPALYPDNDKSRAAPHSIRVNSATLDEVVPADADIRLIKIDVEGAEQRVLSGARVLMNCRPPSYIVAELHNFGLAQFGHSGQSLRALMHEFGYETFLIPGDGPPFMVPAGSRIENSEIINLLFSTPRAVAESWPVFHVGTAQAA